MKQFLFFYFLIVLVIACDTNVNKLIVQTEEQFATVDYETQIVSQTIKSLRAYDSLPITVLTKVYNYNNDPRLQYLTGFTKDDGLQNYLLDSFFYDKLGNDTLKKSFIHCDSIWYLKQIVNKQFSTGKQISYFMNERLLEENRYFKREVFYTYNEKGDILMEKEVVWRQKTVCDSLLKKRYIYNQEGKLDSTVIYTWKNNTWTTYARNHIPSQ